MRFSSLLLLFVFIIGKQSWALKCYYCDATEISTNISTCDNPDVIVCPPEYNMCSKGGRNDNEQLPAGDYKDCGNSDTVGCMNKAGHRECYCSGDLCNAGDLSSSSQRPTVVAAFGFVILFFLV
ncbi:hypothetical protein M3Y94_00668900 [Aphelenchoides besseyi]|nr:hypothetical protein M3Y94_00668900 [Aphelenchoides besseyi]KAI6231318.1 hypothetical protein M3Y95_00369100 [Aphelenchoides besseyi]